MPNSLKCKIKHLYHNRTITERERDRILKALEQEHILDKIRAEIASKMLPFEPDTYNGIINLGIVSALQIIDKYKTESENKK